MHAVSRLALHPHITNIQASWVKMGPAHAAALLRAGANDMGGVLMNESITRAAGASHGQELGPVEMERLISGAGRRPRQRTTLYGTADPRQVERSFVPASPLVAVMPTPPTTEEEEGKGSDGGKSALVGGRSVGSESTKRGSSARDGSVLLTAARRATSVS